MDTSKNPQKDATSVLSANEPQKPTMAEMQQKHTREMEAAKPRADEQGRVMRATAHEEGELDRAVAEVGAARTHAENEAADGDRKLSDAELAAIEEDTLRRRYMYPQKDPTSVPLQALSANEPKKPDMDEILADTNFPATKADLVLRARTRGDLDDRYAMERIEDRMYLDAEDVKRALRA